MMSRGDPRSRGRGFHGSRRGREGRNARAPLKGLFKDAKWHCNCDPRLPAERFRVKKEGKNQGRWFYTCQQNEALRCGFFLWEDDAKVREEAAVLGNTRTEPGVQEGWNAGRDREEEHNEQPRIPPGKGLFARNQRAHIKSEDDSTASPSPPPSYRTNGSPGPGLKRSASDAVLDGEDFGSWTFCREEEARLAAAADDTAPVTPHKVSKTGVYATPVTTTRRKLPWLEEASQETLRGDGYFETAKDAPAADLPESKNPQTPQAVQSAATATTPSPLIRHRDALDDPADDASSLTFEVLSALSVVKLPTETMASLRSILSKHDLRTQGVKRGRDISRLALKAKDAKIVELQARIASLEADQEVERSLARMKKWDSGQRGDLQG